MNFTIMENALELILSLVGSVAGSQVDKIITTIEGWLPIITNEASQLLPLVTNILSTLKGNANLTAQQITAIDALNTQADAAFDAAAAAAQAATPTSTQ
jgi:hypothetical protein